ncbi:MAG: hypothetical protein K2J90_05310 [Lachnospiraceae bacterium]|nr:hypothetical protein [Lachnospiraceae bacterium]
MSDNIICRMEHVTVKEQQNIGLHDVSLHITENHLTALISEDGSAGEVLKVIAGLQKIQSGKADYPGLKSVWMKKGVHPAEENTQSGKIAYSRLKAVTRTGKEPDVEKETKPFLKPIQYVPDDIVRYSGLTVEAFLQGVAGGSQELINEAVRLLSLFNIDVRDLLLEMTIEQNRLVSVIQAMMAKPALLLLNRPYDMLTERTFKVLLKEVVALYAQGGTVVLAAEHYDDVVLPAHDYIFLKEGKVIGRFAKNQLPVPAKVVTLWGGSISPMLSEKMTMLTRRKGYCRFLYEEQNMKELALRLSITGCKNFNIEELTMEEMLFKDYERWIL